MIKRWLVLAFVAVVALACLGAAVSTRLRPHLWAQGLEKLALGFPTENCAGVEFPIVIAHAGGAVRRQTYSNSLEALDFNYSRGCRFFELDLEWTSDGELVLLHDWNANASRIFGNDFGGSWHDREAFLAARRLDGLTSLDLEVLVSWLEEHPDAVVVTDVKWDNIKALKKMRSTVPGAEQRLVPQIYQFDQYPRVRELGFREIILTLYDITATDAEVVDFARTVELSAIAMPVTRAFGGLPSVLAEMGVPAVVHTVNSRHNARRLAELGVDGIFTDYLCACGAAEGP